MELKGVTEFLKGLNQREIVFDPHFYKRSSERPINEGMVRKYLSQFDKSKEIERGKEGNRFKLWFKISGKYSLVLIIEVNTTKVLKVISAWNSNRKWQKQLRQ